MSATVKNNLSAMKTLNTLNKNTGKPLRLTEATFKHMHGRWAFQGLVQVMMVLLGTLRLMAVKFMQVHCIMLVVVRQWEPVLMQV